LLSKLRFLDFKAGGKMEIKCPICGAEYSEGTVRFCKICLYSIGSDPYLTNLLSHPSEEELRSYNQSLKEYRALWQKREDDRIQEVLSNNRNRMVQMEGGTFKMGNSEGYSDEMPIHEVTLESFLIGQYAVTQELWEIIMSNNPSSYKGKKRPVERICWYDTVEFCNKLSEKEGLTQTYHITKKSADPFNLNSNDQRRWSVDCDFSVNGYRLPTEAEWEYAARGGSKSKGFIFSGSNRLYEVGWYGAGDKTGNCTEAEGPSEVGKKLPNESGIFDMSGNIWEWCWDWHAAYNGINQINPRGPKTGNYRVARGGSWNSPAKYCTVSRRGTDTPSDGFSGALDFRLARTKI